ncbi:MAG: hypothetical protein L0J57_00185 [Brachybacterium sp.]|uniref:hypothetical protein n=1 Tax=Brachybacterium alimentarium TaxID=47845 RepID=UPI000DF31EE5|nr:hypothetical protein [Brachybacterium alimentarium]MDN6301456.1 hypothetical protein [Brachybacterium sp.]MDN6327844.1 hypothetical protein [Brachybacterium sp.]RCS68756.1 hypothetical protein CIK68_12465 [Brachybacterium alimentarium]
MSFLELRRINDDTLVAINTNHIIEMWAAKQEDTSAPVETNCYIAIRLTGQTAITRYLPRTPYGHPLDPERISNPQDALRSTVECIQKP